MNNLNFYRESNQIVRDISWRYCLALLLGMAQGLGPLSASEWLTDYPQAVQQARQEGKLLLVAFYDSADPKPMNDLLERVAAHPEGSSRIATHVVVVLPTAYEYESNATPAHATSSSSATNVAATRIRLLSHPAFADMLQRPGFAVLDFSNPTSRYFQYVISVLPTASGRVPTVDQAVVLLGLPQGSLTQRSLIFAVRTHPARPQSTAGELSAMLAEEARSSAQHQANINQQGHHQWDSRFHRINSKLPSGLLAQEVCAESWPGQTLMDSARERVHSWSQSPGHWSAVSGRPGMYGYDMKRGSNGIWYGTGIFGKTR